VLIVVKKYNKLLSPQYFCLFASHLAEENLMSTPFRLSTISLMLLGAFSVVQSVSAQTEQSTTAKERELKEVVPSKAEAKKAMRKTRRQFRRLSLPAGKPMKTYAASQPRQK